MLADFLADARPADEADGDADDARGLLEPVADRAPRAHVLRFLLRRAQKSADFWDVVRAIKRKSPLTPHVPANAERVL